MRYFQTGTVWKKKESARESAIVEALDLKDLLHQGQPCVLATIDPTGVPYTTFVSWVTAHNKNTICLALDARGTALRNLQHTPGVALEILAPDRIVGIRGIARIHRGRIAACPFPSVIVTINVIENRDHTGRGIVWQGPSYRYAKGKEHRYAVERAVLDELEAKA